MTATHLVKRFVVSLWPLGPRRSDDDWATSQLLEGEIALWRRMSRQDRRHSAAVARRVASMLPSDAERSVLAAALLHDVGKIDSDLGTMQRVAATLSAKVAGRDTAELWVKSSGITRRIGLYLKHPEIGGDLLEMAGADPLTSTWAREHHLPPDQWSIDPAIAEILASADDD
jgi:hypothetical protein